MTFVLSVGEAIQIVVYWLTGTSINNDQAYQLAILVAPFVLMIYHKLGITTNEPSNDAASVPPANVAAKSIMWLIIGSGALASTLFARAALAGAMQ